WGGVARGVWRRCASARAGLGWGRRALSPPAPPFLLATITLLIFPLESACALIAQIISSRQPLPTSVFETPSTHPPACGFAEPLAVKAIAATAATPATTATSLATVRLPNTPLLIRSS